MFAVVVFMSIATTIAAPPALAYLLRNDHSTPQAREVRLKRGRRPR
jgi:hypothetical protein